MSAVEVVSEGASPIAQVVHVGPFPDWWDEYDPDLDDRAQVTMQALRFAPFPPGWDDPDPDLEVGSLDGSPVEGLRVSVEGPDTMWGCSAAEERKRPRVEVRLLALPRDRRLHRASFGPLSCGKRSKGPSGEIVTSGSVNLPEEAGSFWCVRARVGGERGSGWRRLPLPEVAPGNGQRPGVGPHPWGSV